MRSRTTLLSIVLSVLMLAHATMTVDHVHLSSSDEVECLAHAGFMIADEPETQLTISLIVAPQSWASSYETLLLANPKQFAQVRAPPHA